MTLAGYLLRGEKQLAGTASSGSRTCPFAPHAWDFRNESVVAYFADVVIGQWAEDNVTDAVFIDEGDAIMCRGHPALSDVNELYRWSNGSVEAYRRSAARLAAAGKRLVLLLKNGFEGAAPISTNIGLCPVPLSAYMQAMQREPTPPWIRYHEYWAAFSDPNAAKGIKGAEMCRNLLHTAIQEVHTKQVAISAHGGNYTKSSTLQLAFAAFMIAQRAQEGAASDWFGWSTGDYWLDDAWQWNVTAKYFEHRWGRAISNATESSAGVFPAGVRGWRYQRRLCQPLG